MKLPRVDGLEVLRALKTDPRTSLIPVVMLTSSNMESDVIRGYRHGANSYVQKPVDFAKFRATIRHVGLYWLTINESVPQVVLLAEGSQ
jgi:two-component system response regulator